MADPLGKTENSHARFIAGSSAISHRAWERVFLASMVSATVLTTVVPLGTYALTLGQIPSFFRSKAQAFVSESKTMSVQQMPILEASMSPNPARGGGDVIIEDGVAVRAQGGFAGETVIPSKDAISIYVVREGDTLSQIADMFEVSVNTIKWANDISGPIRPGQTLTILPVSGVTYTVKKGDSLETIAKKYKGDKDEIAQFNGVTGPLAVGDVLIIPNGQELVAPAPIRRSTTASAPAAAGSYSGYYTHPLPGGRKTQGIHGTNAIDIAAPAGTPIVAAAGGDVIIALEGGWNGGYGTYVVVRHDNGTQSLYAHMSSAAVGRGQRVNQGQVIGYVGNTGRSTGSHLHFEIRGGPRNPF